MVMKKKKKTTMMKKKKRQMSKVSRLREAAPSPKECRSGLAMDTAELERKKESPFFVVVCLHSRPPPPLLAPSRRFAIASMITICNQTTRQASSYRNALKIRQRDNNNNNKPSWTHTLVVRPDTHSPFWRLLAGSH